MVNDRINLLGLNLAGLEKFVDELGEKRFRAGQLLQWLHQYGVDDLDAMTNISKKLRATIGERAVIQGPEIVSDHTASDGTRKWVLRMAGGSDIETVYIPDGKRGTLCISSQVGCQLNCTFCSTARQGFNRNLTAAEIIGQVWVAKRLLQPYTGKPPPTQSRAITNVVFMGMGEPLLNLDPVTDAIDIMLDDLGYGLSRRRVTVSTSGVVPMLELLRERAPVSLAVSLHAPNDELRCQLVPLNKKYPIAMLLEACKQYVADEARQKVTFEYAMLKGVNDQPAHARELAKVLRGVPSKINLIPFNPFPEAPYERSDDQTIDRFQQIMIKAGYITTLRKTRGDDIDAACGQLVGKVLPRQRRQPSISAGSASGPIAQSSTRRSNTAWNSPANAR